MIICGSVFIVCGRGVILTPLLAETADSDPIHSSLPFLFAPAPPWTPPPLLGFWRFLSPATLFLHFLLFLHLSFAILAFFVIRLFTDFSAAVTPPGAIF